MLLTWIFATFVIIFSVCSKVSFQSSLMSLVFSSRSSSLFPRDSWNITRVLEGHMQSFIFSNFTKAIVVLREFSFSDFAILSIFSDTVTSGFSLSSNRSLMSSSFEDSCLPTDIMGCMGGMGMASNGVGEQLRIALPEYSFSDTVPDDWGHCMICWNLVWTLIFCSMTPKEFYKIVKCISFISPVAWC